MLGLKLFTCRMVVQFVNTTVSFAFFDLLFMFTGGGPVLLKSSHDSVRPRVEPVCDVWHLVKCYYLQCQKFDEYILILWHLSRCSRMKKNLNELDYLSHPAHQVVQAGTGRHQLRGNWSQLCEKVFSFDCVKKFWMWNVVAAPQCCSSSLGRPGKTWLGRPTWVCYPPDEVKITKNKCIFKYKHFVSQIQILIDLP